MMLFGMRLRKVAELKVRRHPKRVASIPLAVAGERRVDGEAQGTESRCRRTFDEASRDPAVLVYVELEPSRAAPGRFRDRLEAAVRDGAGTKHRVLIGCGASGRGLGLEMTESMKAHRRHEHRHRNRGPEYRRLERTVGDSAEHPRKNLESRPCPPVLGKRPFITGAAGNVVE